MKAYYKDMFLAFLRTNCKYPTRSLRTDTYKYDSHEYYRVEVLSGDYVIQAFVLMSDDQCQNLDKFPFYRAYNQRNDYGFLIPPACYIAVNTSRPDDWSIHNSSDLRHEITSSTLMNYRAAVERYMNRLKFHGNKRIVKDVSFSSLCALAIIVLYYAAHILSINGVLRNTNIPFDGSVLSILTLIAILLILPPLIPYIKFQYHELSLEVNQD